MSDQVIKTEEEWEKELTPEQYRILRGKGTEAPFTGEYADNHDRGMFNCAACGNQLFSSDTKFETKIPGLRGWPSFDQALPGAIRLEHDESSGMNRTEVLCARCGSHLGHVFDDDTETETGKHYCINSACLLLTKTKD